MKKEIQRQFCFLLRIAFYVSCLIIHVFEWFLFHGAKKKCLRESATNWKRRENSGRGGTKSGWKKRECASAADVLRLKEKEFTCNCISEKKKKRERIACVAEEETLREKIGENCCLVTLYQTTPSRKKKEAAKLWGRKRNWLHCYRVPYLFESEKKKILLGLV